MTLMAVNPHDFDLIVSLNFVPPEQFPTAWKQHPQHQKLPSFKPRHQVGHDAVPLWIKAQIPLCQVQSFVNFTMGQQFLGGIMQINHSICCGTQFCLELSVRSVSMNQRSRSFLMAWSTMLRRSNSKTTRSRLSQICVEILSTKR
jgi:hypothetical protein